MALPSLPTDWVEARTWVQDGSAPSLPTAWVEARTWSDVGDAPSLPTQWIEARTWIDSAVLPSAPTSWVQATIPVSTVTPARLSPSGWIVLAYPGGGGGGSPTPPETTTMLIGAAVSPRQADVLEFEGQVGQVHVMRSFDTGFPATWAQGNGGWHPDRMVSWHSIKPDVAQTASGALDNALAAWVGSIPASHRCMLTFQHEPENPNKGINPAQWRTASRRFYDIVKSIRPDIPVGPIIMGWTMNPGSGRNPDDWDPGADKVDFYGVDAYQAYLFPPSGSPTGWTSAPHPEMITQVNRAAQRDRPAAVGETACGDYQGDFVRKRDWIKACVDLMAENNAIAFCYFNTMVNHDMSPNSLITDDPLTLAYYSGLLANPPTIQEWVS